MKPKLNCCLLLIITVTTCGLAQQVTTTQTSAGYFYPLGTTTFNQNCSQNNGGTWLGPDSSIRGGCYLNGFYHLGFDMFNSLTAVSTPVYAAATGQVILIDPGSSWTALSGPATDNTAVFVSSSTGSGASYVMVYGHLLRSAVRVQTGDIVTAGTQLGVLGYWNPPHVHLGIWPNTGNVPPSPWGRDVMTNYANPHGATDPLIWITSSGSSATCQNGGAAYYHPNGGTAFHPHGTLFTVKNDPTNPAGTVYVLYNGVTYGIPTPSLLNTLYGNGRGFGFRDVLQISPSEYNLYSHGGTLNSPLPNNGKSQPDGRLIQQWGGTEISIVSSNGTRRPFASAEAFLNLGYQFCNVAGVSDYGSYPLDPAGPITQ